MRGTRKAVIATACLFFLALWIPVISSLSGSAFGQQAPATTPTNSSPTAESSSPSDSSPTPPPGDPSPSDSSPTPPPGDPSPSDSSPTPPPGGPSPSPEAQKATELAASEEEEDTEREVLRIPLVGAARGGVLLQKDQLVLEPALAYAYSTNTRLILSGFSVLPLIVLGDLESEKARTQTLTPIIAFRYGIIRGLQLDFRLPLVYQTISRLRVSTETAGQVEENSEDFGIGDIAFGLSYQFLYEQDWYPDMVLRIGATAPTGKSQFDIFEDIAAGGPILSVEEFVTRLNDEGSALGTGRWFIDTSISGVKALDPAILFGTVGYRYSPASTETLIRITANPGEGGISLIPEADETRLGHVNEISQSLGLAVSLNNRVSMNFSFSNLVRFSTKVDGQKVPDSDIHVSNLNLGFNVAVTRQFSTNITGTVGLTPDAPDVAFSLTTPFSITNPLARSIDWLGSLFSTPVSPPPGQEPGAQ